MNPFLTSRASNPAARFSTSSPIVRLSQFNARRASTSVTFARNFMRPLGSFLIGHHYVCWSGTVSPSPALSVQILGQRCFNDRLVCHAAPGLIFLADDVPKAH
jgi:hypothetical protein